LHFFGCNIVGFFAIGNQLWLQNPPRFAQKIAIIYSKKTTQTASYFNDFFVKQRQKVRDKIIWTFDLIEMLDKVPETYLRSCLNMVYGITHRLFLSETRRILQS